MNARVILMVLSFLLPTWVQAEDQNLDENPVQKTPTFFQDGVRAQAFSDFAAQQGVAKIITRVSFGWALWSWDFLDISGGIDASLSLKGTDLTAFGPTVDLLFKVLPSIKVGVWGSQANGYYPRDTVTEQQNKYVDVSSQTFGLRFMYQPYEKSAVYLGFGQRTKMTMLAPAADDEDIKNKISNANSTVMLGVRFST